MDTSQVVIHFIGLVLFSTQVSNDPGLHAILPAIGHGEQHLAPPTPVAPATIVEPHMALLIFHEDTVKDDSQWPTSTIQSRFPHAASLASYRYVELTGEHITFMVDAPDNDRAVIPENMPRFSCARMPRLTPEYQWPYAKAAAVVDIPEGKLSVCGAGRLSPGRVDTRLVLNTSGTLTVVAVSSGGVKTLVLRTTDEPTISLANVPPPQPEGARARMAGAPHFHAYLEMIGSRGRTTTCSGRPRVDENAPPVPDCEERRVLIPPPTTSVVARPRSHRPPVLPPRPATTGSYFPVGLIFMANAECSNTQWP